MLAIGRRIAIWAQVGLAFVGHGALACAFHTYTPDPTLIDTLLESEHVVLARPDPSDPARFVAVDALIGPAQGIDLPFAVDPETRAHMARHPTGAVLFARDGAYGPWLQLARLDPGYAKVIETVMTRQTAWLLGRDADRFKLFAARLDDPNPDLRALALRELDRVDYATLRSLRVSPPRDLRGALDTGDPQLRPIRILLAGLSQDAAFLPVLADGLQSAAARDVPYLGAYATALIELGGADAVAGLINRQIAPAGLPLATREKLIEALALQKQTGSGRIRRVIARAMPDLLAAAPELAGPVARQFGLREDWSLLQPIKAAAASRPPANVADIFAVTQYIETARRK